MLLPIVLLLQDSPAVAAALAEYREKTGAVIRCQAPRNDAEITVCARRRSYRYQTPLVSTARRSNAHAQDDMVWTSEAQGHAACGQGAFTVRCGSVGASVTVRSDGATAYKSRETPP